MNHFNSTLYNDLLGQYFVFVVDDGGIGREQLSPSADDSFQTGLTSMQLWPEDTLALLTKIPFNPAQGIVGISKEAKAHE